MGGRELGFAILFFLLSHVFFFFLSFFFFPFLMGLGGGFQKYHYGRGGDVPKKVFDYLWCNRPAEGTR